MRIRPSSNVALGARRCRSPSRPSSQATAVPVDLAHSAPGPRSPAATYGRCRVPSRSPRAVAASPRSPSRRVVSPDARVERRRPRARPFAVAAAHAAARRRRSASGAALAGSPWRASAGRPGTPAPAARSSVPSRPPRSWLGVAALAVSVGGAVTVGDVESTPRHAAAATGPARGQRPQRRQRHLPGQPPRRRDQSVSRDSAATPSPTPPTQKLVQQAEAQAERAQRRPGQVRPEGRGAGGQDRQEPLGAALAGYHLTARFGEYGLWSQLPHRSRLRGPERHPDPRRRQRRGDLGRLRRRLRQQDRGHPRRRHRAVVLPPDLLRSSASATTVRAGELIGYVGSTGNTHRPAPPPRGPPRRAATRSTRTPR